MSVVDFTNVEVKDFTPVPAGVYLLRVIEAEERASASSEHDYLSLSWEVVDGEFEGRRLWDILSYSPKALWKLKGFLLDVVGISEDDLVDDFQIIPDDFIELESVARVIVEPSTNGEMRNSITKYLPS